MSFLIESINFRRNSKSVSVPKHNKNWTYFQKWMNWEMFFCETSNFALVQISLVSDAHCYSWLLVKLVSKQEKLRMNWSVQAISCVSPAKMTENLSILLLNTNMKFKLFLRKICRFFVLFFKFWVLMLWITQFWIRCILLLI